MAVAGLNNAVLTGSTTFENGGTTALNNAGTAQFYFGYNGAAQYQQAMISRHNGALAGNALEFWLHNTGDAIGAVPTYRAFTIDDTGIQSPGKVTSSGPTSGIGYETGAGGAVTQITSRTTGVTLNKVCGQITLVSAAGTAAWQTFTVTNSTVAATDVIRLSQASGADLNMIHVTNVAAGSFKISFATTGGTTTEQPVFNFAVVKAVNA